MIIEEEQINADFFRAYMYGYLKEQLGALNLSGEGVEFGATNGIIQSYCGPGVKFHESRDFPKYDVCDSGSYERNWDVIVTDQVLEHTKKPWEAFRLWGMHGKTVVLTVPFLMYVHAFPGDFWRMTTDAIKFLAIENGFKEYDIRSWGNKKAVGWLFETGGWHPPSRISKEEMWENVYENDPKHPFVIWAILRK